MSAPNMEILIPLDMQESRWRLVPKNPSENEGHSVSVRFFVENDSLCGAVICRGKKKIEIPLADVDFDGSILKFRMQDFKDLKSKEIISSPYITTLKVRDSDCFEGEHINVDGVALPVSIRLIRERT